MPTAARSRNLDLVSWLISIFFKFALVMGDKGPTAVYSADEYAALPVNPFQSFYSRSDLWPPVLYLNTSNTQSLAPGYIFIGQWGGPTPAFQPGPLILDVLPHPLHPR